MVERALGQTEGLKVSEDSALVAKQRELNAQSWRIAAIWNRKELAEQKPGTNIAISFNTLHLDALRRNNTATARIANPPSEHAIEVQVEEMPALESGEIERGDSEVTVE